MAEMGSSGPLPRSPASCSESLDITISLKASSTSLCNQLLKCEAQMYKECSAKRRLKMTCKDCCTCNSATMGTVVQPNGIAAVGMQQAS